MEQDSSKLIVAWAVWYINEGIITSKDMEFNSLPKDGVLGMVTFEQNLKPDGAHMRNVLTGYDYYFRAVGLRDFIYGCDLGSHQYDVVEDIQLRYKEPIILRGKWSDRITLHKALDEMGEYQWRP